MIVEAIEKSGEYLLAQGVLGVTTLLLSGATAYLWRENRSDRKTFDDDLVEERMRHRTELSEERSRHAVEIAAERKLNAELQEARLTELRASLDAVKHVTATVDLALKALGRRS